VILAHDLQLGEANGAHKPHHDKPDQAAGSDDSAQHGDMIRLGAVGERAHAQNVSHGGMEECGMGFGSSEVCGVWKLRHVLALAAGTGTVLYLFLLSS